MSGLRLRNCAFAVLVTVLILANIYMWYQLTYLVGTRRPLKPQLTLYQPEEVLRFPPYTSHHEYRLFAPMDRPFVIFMGYAATAVRIVVLNLTLQKGPRNITDLCMRLRAENIGLDRVVVFHERDRWILLASEYGHEYVSTVNPVLSLQPLEIGYESVRFSLSSSLEPKSIFWFRWTGAGWTRIAIVWVVSA